MSYPLFVKRFALFLLQGVCLLTSCQETARYVDNVVLAEVGNAKLSRIEVRAQMPSGLHGEDSLAFVEQCVRQWVDEQLLYQLGVRNVNHLAELEKQVEEYRRTLISNTYEKQLLESRIEPATDEECQAFYALHVEQFRLAQPIVQGLFIRVPLPQSQLAKLKSLLKDYLKGKTEIIEELESFCLQRATAYDNFADQWIDAVKIIERIPQTLHVTADDLLQKGKVVEYSDSDNLYVVVITDCRGRGETSPESYAIEDIRELLTRRKQREFRSEMRRYLFEEGVTNGSVLLHLSSNKTQDALMDSTVVSPSEMLNE